MAIRLLYALGSKKLGEEVRLAPDLFMILIHEEIKGNDVLVSFESEEPNPQFLDLSSSDRKAKFLTIGTSTYRFNVVGVLNRSLGGKWLEYQVEVNDSQYKQQRVAT